MKETLSKLDRLEKLGFAVGAPGLVFCCLGFIFDRRPFYISYLFAFLFWGCLSLGCFYCGMIHYLTGGKWGAPARRLWEAGFMTLPLMALFFIPIFFGLRELYPWARPESLAANRILAERAAYENPSLFIVRGAVFFGIWIFIARRLRKWSLLQDQTTEVSPMMKIRAISGPGVAIVPLTASFAFVDWAMTVETDWSSTIFPVIILAGQMLTAIAFTIVVLAWLRHNAPFAIFGEKPFHDLGSLLLAFVLFWTYVAFSQVLLIYSANLPHEISWYLRRIANDWVWMVGVIGFFHFFAPFIVLLFRGTKKNVTLLAAAALLIFAVHVVEVFWMVAPAFYLRIEVHWTDFAAWFGMGGTWLGIFAGNLKRHPLLARNDPRQENLFVETAHAK